MENTIATIILVTVIATTLYLRFNTPEWLENAGVGAGSALRG